MKKDNTLTINIPVPWSNQPVRLHATGVVAVIVGACVAIVIVAGVVIVRPA